jgi:negative regulator of flagellin synthesis FlgM
MFTNRLNAQLNRFVSVGYDFDWSERPVAGGRAVWSSPVQEGDTDMEVRGIGGVSGVGPIRVTHAPGTREAAAAQPAAPRDQLEISTAGQLLDQLSQNPDVRSERLAQIKQAIADGTYDTDEKLEAALLRMFDAVEADLDRE